jgi:anti-sigma factor RsiW
MGEHPMSEHIDRLTLDAYVEQELPAAERRVVEAHLTTCPTCQVRLATAKQIPALLVQMPREMSAPNLAARINLVVAAQRTQSAPQWTRVLLPAAFALGLILLIVTVPHWANWAQALATAQLPTAQTALAWLGRLIVEPSMIWDDVVVFLDQLTISSADEMDVLITLASLVLVVASVTALAQLLNDESSTVTAWRVSA